MILYRSSDWDGVQETVGDYSSVMYNPGVLVMVYYKKSIKNVGYGGFVPEEVFWCNTEKCNGLRGFP